MKRGFWACTVLVVMLLLAGCSSMAKLSWQLISPGGAVGLSFINEDISVTFTRIVSMLDFSITNISDTPIKVVWDNCAFTGFNGNPSRVMHYGVRYIEKDRSMPPSIIPVGQTLKEGVTPVDNVMYLPYIGWTTLAELPITAGKDYYGRTISFLLCYEINGLVKYETFTFQFGPPEMATEGYNGVLDFSEAIQEADIVYNNGILRVFLPLTNSKENSPILMPSE